MPKQSTAKKATTKAKVKTYGTREDFGKPAGQYFAEQAADKRALLERLHVLVMKAVPAAQVAITSASTSSRRRVSSSIRPESSRVAARSAGC